MIKNILSGITGAVGNVYSNVLSLLQTVLKSKKVNASIVVVFVDMFIVARPEFEGFRPQLLQITTLVWGGVVAPFAAQDLIIAFKTGESKYQPKSA